jgi:two-component system sensor histidine kinase SenX3
LAEAAQRKVVTIAQILPPALPPVLADEDGLTRIVRHLLDNAVKFSPPHSTVTLSAERRDVMVRVAVRDEGPGIPASERENIFKLFYQMDGSSTRRAGGLGLGLSLAKKLLEGHEAMLRVESEAGHGSTFYFELPIA